MLNKRCRYFKKNWKKINVNFIIVNKAIYLLSAIGQ